MHSHSIIYTLMQKYPDWAHFRTFEGFLVKLDKYVMTTVRPICPTCNKKVCAINYVKNSITHYRSICDDCGRKKAKQLPRKPRWSFSGYKKKPTCDLCGFHTKYSSQVLVYHIDGKLENVELANLRTICLNCSEVVKRKQINWRRGDLQVDQ